MSTQNIEDTIFNDALPVNPYPMVNRLLELLNETRNKGLDWKSDKRVSRLMWLLNSTFLETTIGNFDLSEWWTELKHRFDTCQEAKQQLQKLKTLNGAQ